MSYKKYLKNINVQRPLKGKHFSSWIGECEDHFFTDLI